MMTMINMAKTKIAAPNTCVFTEVKLRVSVIICFSKNETIQEFLIPWRKLVFLPNPADNFLIAPHKIKQIATAIYNSG